MSDEVGYIYQSKKLADELIKLGLFMQETNIGCYERPLYRNYRMSILLFGDPKLGVGPAKRTVYE